MSYKLFTKFYDQKKKKVNISLDTDLKAKLNYQKSVDDISISERIESLYRNHQQSVENTVLSDSSFKRSRGERGKAMYSNKLRSVCGVYLTPDAIAFFDEQAEKKKSDRSKIIEIALVTLFDESNS